MDAIFQGFSSPILGPVYALLAGILTSASPCALTALPLVAGHMAGAATKHRFRDLSLFLLGLTLALTSVGVAAGAIGKSLILTAPWIRWVAGFAFVFAGVAYLDVFGKSTVCETPLATGLSMDGTEHEARRSRIPRALSSAVMGALYGLSASPCSTPALIAILALVAATGSTTRGALLLFCYSAGQSFLVVLAGVATSTLQGILESSWGLRAVNLLRKAGGVVTIGFGLFVLLRPLL